MKLSLFSFLIVIGHFSCVEKGNLHNEEEAYQVINWFLKRDTPPCLCKGYYLLVNRELDEFAVGVEESIVLSARLSGEEIKNLIEQNKRSRSVLIDSNRIPSRRVISIDLVKSMKNQKTLWDFLKKDYEQKAFQPSHTRIFYR